MKHDAGRMVVEKMLGSPPAPRAENSVDGVEEESGWPQKKASVTDGLEDRVSRASNNLCTPQGSVGINGANRHGFVRRKLA
ncbi:hypothetical protein NDU88_002689 [Pleurodeles waltl]|uniref:Uncharacterized protein n=1 Tax=Pleurodeles waltl TaxID=8319 RepID=A0AAV7Q6R6_PLEWA|nr:hypothetical protein NDU88_002689 [Pleurodeles waltl]